MVKVKTCIFISGQGSNLNKLIYRSRDSNFPIKINLIVSNNKNAYGINYAKKYQIKSEIILNKYDNKQSGLFKDLLVSSIQRKT